MTPELHRPVAVSQIGPAGLDVTVEASPEECEALALRMDLPAVVSLTCAFRLERDAASNMLAHGRLTARVVQVCVVSLEEFAAPLEERFTVRCVAEGTESEDADPNALDEITYVNGVLDLGEATAEQLALALDPYPRAPGAELPDTTSEPDDLPFASLAARRQRH